MHRVLELLCSEPAGERTIDRARELAATAWPETRDDADFIALGLDAATQRQFRWRGWTAIEKLWELEDPTEVDVEATEVKVSATVGGVPFFGIVDRLDSTSDGLVVTDYKTGKAPRPGDVPEKNRSGPALRRCRGGPARRTAQPGAPFTSSGTKSWRHR
ncbi:MAG: hypothetical protein CM1200mP26_21140 [Acidimicrobiales bacterium]|nr:MAG: hypothetical protein CM1200mP26_21140 [Acidimicrobiales bacterium]